MTHNGANKLIAVPNHLRLNARLGRTLERPRIAAIAWGIAYEMLRYKTAEVIIELNAVVLAKYSRPYNTLKTMAAIVVFTGKSLFLSIFEKNFGYGVPPCK